MRAFVQLIFSGGVVYGLAELGIVLAGAWDRFGPADVLVVLGNKVERDGSPSPRLRARLEKALELWRAGVAPRIVVSGAPGAEGHDESAVMVRWLAERGVPLAALVADPSGITTWETARFVSRWMQERGLRRAVVVTQYFHVARSRLALRRFGVPVVGGARADYIGLRDLYSIPREVAGFAWYRMRSLPGASTGSPPGQLQGP